jgi:peptide/nickel transport system permease protein
MLREIGNRALQMVFIFWVFVTLLFFMLHMAPGDISIQFTLDPNLPPEARQIIIERLGLDRPMHEMYLVYLRNLIQGEFGFSFMFYPRSVNEILWVRLPRTIVLFTVATILANWLGYVVGKLLAWRRGGFTEYSTTIVGVLLYTVFYPWFALIMIWLFAFIIPLFPTRGFLTPARWRAAPFRADEVFLTMIWTTTALLVVLTVIWLLARKMQEGPSRKMVAYGGSALAVGGFAARTLLESEEGIGALRGRVHRYREIPVIATYHPAALLRNTSWIRGVWRDLQLARRMLDESDPNTHDHSPPAGSR